METGSIECSWTIQVPRGHYVQLTFIELSLENPAAGGQCTGENFVEVRDYNDTGMLQLSLVSRAVSQYILSLREKAAPGEFIMV